MEDFKSPKEEGRNKTKCYFLDGIGLTLPDAGSPLTKCGRRDESEFRDKSWLAAKACFFMDSSQKHQCFPQHLNPNYIVVILCIKPSDGFP